MKLIGDIAKDGEVKAIASSAITAGAPLVVNSDGTVGAITAAATVAIGSKTTFNTADLNDLISIFDPDTNKIILAYKDEGNSSHGSIRVATIDPSNNSVTFGTKKVFSSAITFKIGGVYDTNSNRLVLIYTSGPNTAKTGSVIVGTVSGTTVNFGTAVVFNNASTNEQGVGNPSITFDSNSNRIVIAYEDTGNSKYGTTRVGTVDPSDNSISFGSEEVFIQADVGTMGMCFDTNKNRVILAYTNDASTRAEVIVGTVDPSDNSISFGSALVFNAVRTLNFDQGVIFDSNTNQVVIIYGDTGGSANIEALVGSVDSSDNSITFGSIATGPGYLGAGLATAFNSDTNTIIVGHLHPSNAGGNVLVATVSGTDVSFGTPSVYNATNYSINESIAYDSNSKRALLLVKDYGTNGNGVAYVYRTPAVTNITTENFIGLSDGVYAIGQTATIKTDGSIVSLSSLTAGQEYFVQADASLGTTAATISVSAGTAISSNKLIVRG